MQRTPSPSCALSARNAVDSYRPVLHYTARDTWLNDPNGLVWYQGIYHLFYQNNPFGNVWGNMSWGHATSTDLLHWTEQPVAIACDDEEDIFSGSIVVDTENTSGFGTSTSPALVAIYTSAYKDGSLHEGTQAQSLAYSTDAGMSWTKYAHNPVLGRESAHFRDPKVFLYNAPGDSYWVMVAVEAQHQQVVLYRSSDLKAWTYLSSFGPANAGGGEWECPDLFPLPVAGQEDQTKWVLIVNINPGAVAGGSGGQYFIGDFDGVTFHPDADSIAPRDEVGGVDLERCLWLDWGRDYYAGVSFSNVPNGRCIMIGWMNNWDYANSLPTTPWRSGMSLARRVTLESHGEVARLVQHPILPVPLPAPDLEVVDFELASAEVTLPLVDATAAQLIEAEIMPGTSQTIRLELLPSLHGRAPAVLSYNVATSELCLDRREGGDTSFNETFGSIEVAPVPLEDGVLRLRIVIDHCSVEVFAQNGRVVLSDLIFPVAEADRCAVLSVEGGRAIARRLAVLTLR
ncbi:glycoside hydrolase family 32 protein [Zhihengliuella flava]|uniref:Levanase/levanbiose-producing levanase n=1 Tax=Zhihengliuella flava TaxID=1285193 RepID=A0A931DAE1_9MICC|nr:glycoside hydrolase family 32 protein [Zhihengliuella flava]MBG6085284.1 levanase/levanbiose-producing levanase [Zhihengliuella flava]